MKNRKLNITEMGRMNVEEFKASEKMPLVVVLDDVRSMYNVGSVFRTADAFRVEGICLCGITACPPHPEIHKTALGAEDTVAWQHFPTALEAVQHLKEQGYMVLSIEQCEGSTLLQSFSPILSEAEKKFAKERIIGSHEIEEHFKSCAAMLHLYRELKKYCDKRNIKLINLSSKTIIDSLPRQRLSDILNKSEEKK